MARANGSRGFGDFSVLAMLVIGIAGCQVESYSGQFDDESDAADEDADDLDDADDQLSDVQPIRGQLAAGRQTTIRGTTTIYDIQHPSSVVTPGSSVLVDSATIKITAVGADRFWIQEVGGSGLCDEVVADVAYRGIAVMPASSPDAQLVIGQRVRVTGTVAELDGNTTLIDAQVTAIGAPSQPYEAQCDRFGSASSSEALESVLVLTAGHSGGFGPPQDGVWGLEPCFAPGATLEVGSLLYAPEAWSSSWQWVRGVMVQNNEARELMPRDADDVMADLGDDVCL